MGEPESGAGIRLDKFLWFTRLAKRRALAQQLAEGRHLRIDGRVIDRAHAMVRIGDTLTFPLNDRIRVIRVVALPHRRGTPAEARACYLDLAPIENVSQEAASD